MTYQPDTALSVPSRPRSRALPSWPTTRPLRAWQQEALEAVFAHDGSSFLASATPAAGKTTFGLRVAHRMLEEGRVGRVAVIAPTTHICRQWAADAARYGIDLEPNRPNSAGPEPRDRHGVAVTYATLAAGPGVHRRRCAELPTLLIADEPHHMGELASWGRSTQAAFERARFRLLLSGTPFRSDNSPIPWVTYDDDGVSSADYAYGYTEALIDGVCRPVTFHTYDGDMEWVSDGRRRRADFTVALPAAEAARRLRTALDPEGDWVGHVLSDAHRELIDLRAGAHHDAGGLVIAADKEHAEKLADRLARIAGERPEIVTSDAPDASARIAPLRRRLGHLARVGADGLRGRRRPAPARRRLRHQRAHGAVLPPGRRPLHPPHARGAGGIRSDVAPVPAQRPDAQAARGPDRGGAQPRARGQARGRGDRARRARRGRATRSTRCPRAPAATTTCCRRPRPATPLQLFADAAPAPSPALAAFGGGITATTTATTPASAPSRPAGETAYEKRERLREERRNLVSTIARRTGEEHRVINARINRDVGAPSVAKSTVDQLEKANRLLEREAAR